MAFLSTINIIGSGMTAQQLRLDVISENITNINTTRTEGDGGAYRRKTVTLESESNKNGFRYAFDQAMRRANAAGKARVLGGGYASLVYRGFSNRGYENAGGVHVAEIGEDDSELPFIYDPNHPDANEEGYVEMPNVTLVKEVADAMAASQAFSADVTAFNTLKSMISSGLQISV